MKHNITAISFLIAIFLLAQVVGLAVTAHYLEKPELPMKIERPSVPEQQQSYTFIPIFIFIIIATLLGLLLVKFSMMRLWKFWFLLSVWLCLSISFSAFIPEKIAIGIAVVLALLKVFRPNVIIHNFTEVFIYGALAAIFVPILNVTAVVVLLALISIYDYIAVRRTKHMVKLAKFQGKSKMFAGILLPYNIKKEEKKPEGHIAYGKKVNIPKVSSKKADSAKQGVAILGGGDIGFPLLFAGVVMKQFSLAFSDYRIFIIPLFAAVSLAMLFLFADNKKFYPAMPYISAGCLAGYGIVWLLV
ncbi:MAG: presenilin family intramembrane aspartyl protease [Candidatus Nanoarchaeia archaeon]|nr:presenilin family intramembrane aspartyl protease [Candidatus Nanoarchaeia archaeon]